MNQSAASDSRRKLPRPCSGSAARAQAMWSVTRSSWTAATRHVERSTGRTEMKRLAVTVILVSLLAAACFHASPGGRVSGSDGTSVASRTATARSRSEGVPPMLTLNEIRMVAPALEKYTQDRLLGEVWKRPGLTPRDRSIVTLAALIARNQTIEMPYYVNLALDNGVKPRE